jgi:hypothetical protein
MVFVVHLIYLHLGLKKVLNNIVFSIVVLEDIWSMSDVGWSHQFSLVIKVAIINILNTIWQVKNSVIFSNMKIFWKTTIARTPSGPIYKKKFGQQKLMHLVKKLDQIHSFLLT